MWGLKPQDVMIPGSGPTLWWGARAIYKPDAKLQTQMIDLLHDRQGWEGEDDEAKRKQLSRWVTKSGIPKLRKKLRLDYVGIGAQQLVWITDGAFNIIADPKASHGYLFLAAWRDEAWQHTQQSPKSRTGPDNEPSTETRRH